MSTFGIEVYDSAGIMTLGMNDFTYTKIFETVIPAPGSDTSVYNVTVPGYNPSTCVVLFSPTVYAQGGQSDYTPTTGVIPVYRDMGGEVVGVVRTVYERYWNGSTGKNEYYLTPRAREARMEVYRIL